MRPSDSLCAVPPEQALAIARHALLHREERRSVAGAAQCRQVGLRIALVLVFEIPRKGDVAHDALPLHLLQAERRLALRFATRIDHGRCDVVEALRPPRPGVVDAGTVTMFQKVKIDRDRVLHRHKITLLLAVGVAAASFEERDAAFASILIEEMKRDGSHASLVLLALAKIG